MIKVLNIEHQNLENILTKFFSKPLDSSSYEPLREVFMAVKREGLERLILFLQTHSHSTEYFKGYIENLFYKRPFNISLTEANILSENAFIPEFRKRLLDKVLPSVENENSVWFLIDSISVRPGKDLNFLEHIPEEKMKLLLEILGFDAIITRESVKKEIVFSANLLAWRSIGTALETDVMNMVPEYKNYDNPFLALQNEMDQLTRRISENPKFYFTSKDIDYKQIKIYLTQCQAFVEKAFKNSHKYGISGKINQSLLKINQQIIRISEILNLLVIDEKGDEYENSKNLIFNILKYKSHKNNISELVDDSTRLISHLITNHTAEAGSHYITSGVKSYMKMFWKASGGGVIVGGLCILKMLYSYYPTSEFMHGFLYAMNYAMGFVMIYLMRFVLATKQPAMTAATMAKVLSDQGNTKKNYVDFAHLVSKLFRSQFIAFIGNVVWAFPVALLLIYGLDVLFNYNFAADKSTKLLHDLDPFESKALYHASIAGFFLFISGIISGNVGNNSVFYHIPERIAKNPMLRRIFGKKITTSLSRYYSRNWAGIVSNFWFGVFLGITAPVGVFLGLDLDIRHITFAAGNFALGLYGKGFSIGLNAFLISLLTVFLIGFFNFIVSFGLSMTLAMRSRKVNFGGVKEILKEIAIYFMKNPLRFFLPIRSSELDVRAQEMINATTSNKSEDQ